MNLLDIQITHEGERNAIVKLTGVLDSSNISETPAIALTDFLNRADERIGSLTGFRVDLIEYVIANNLEVILEWQGTNPQQIYALAGRGRISSFNYGGFVPDKTRAGYNGNINLRTKNFVPAVDGEGNLQVQNFTIVLELIKLYTQ